MANSDTRDDGGAAYPFVQWRSPDGMTSMVKQEGMTLRDYFAAKALPTIITEYMNAPSEIKDHIAEWVGADEPITSKVTSAFAYKIADAMLEARKK